MLLKFRERKKDINDIRPTEFGMLNVECSTKVQTSLSKLKIKRTGIQNCTIKCGVLVDQCLGYKKALTIASLGTDLYAWGH